MSKIGSNSAFNEVERHFSVRFSKYDSADRAEIEQFIIKTFHHTFGADIRRFKPYLMSLRDLDHKLIGVCGLHSATKEKLFIEHFLEMPIEAVLSTHTGHTVNRTDIVEIDNFSIEDLEMSRYLVTAINDQLYFTAKQWAVLTATPALRDVFIDLGLCPEVLADADDGLLSSEDRKVWGNYFDQAPQILAIKRMDRRNKARADKTGNSST